MNNDSLKARMFTVPITTGAVIPNRIPSQTSAEGTGASFQDVLKKQLEQSGVEFSKHAVNRVLERNIPVSQTNMERLNTGVELARAKGLNDTLILVDKTAYLVSIKNSKVITTVNGDDLRGNVFTNIDGTVIV